MFEFCSTICYRNYCKVTAPNLICTMEIAMHHQWTSMNIERNNRYLFEHGIFWAANTQQTITVAIISLKSRYSFLLFMGKRTNKIWYVSKEKGYKPLGLKLKNSSRTSWLLKNTRIFVFIFNFYLIMEFQTSLVCP